MATNQHQGTMIDTWHGNEPGNCPDCEGNGHNRGVPGSGSCPHCEGTGSVAEVEA